MTRPNSTLALAATLLLCLGAAARADDRPNIVFVFTDDQRHDALGVADRPIARTPNLDKLASRGVRFSHAFVTLAICAPSRAAVMTGQYGSVNGVTNMGLRVRAASPRLPKLLAAAGYRTGVFGKWHLPNDPADLGFDTAATFHANGPYYDRKATIDGRDQTVPGYIDDAMADRAIDFIKRSHADGKPFFAWLCTQLPHMDGEHDWPAQQRYLDLYTVDDMPLPPTWDDGLAGKPPYIAAQRPRTQALHYGYDDPQKVRRHARRYAAATTQADAAIGRVIDAVDAMGLAGDTWFIATSDNGWMLGEHGLTSKVLAYEPSIRVPMLIAGPGVKHGNDRRLVLNIDLTPTILGLAGLDVPTAMHGRSLLPLLRGEPTDWRDAIVYEAPTPVLGCQPALTARGDRFKLIRTFADKTCTEAVFDELYDLEQDPDESHNLIDKPEHAALISELAARIDAHRRTIFPTRND
jgi:arylsulfatase A-like enzyme